jgi:hypothetical protein
MSDQIHTYPDFCKQIRAALQRQEPRWIDVNGNSPLCDSYEARFAELLGIPTPHENVPQLENSQ